MKCKKQFKNCLTKFKKNNVKFDVSKSKLIYFKKFCTISGDKIFLSNDTTLKLQKIIKHLKIYLDKKFNFNLHANHKIATIKQNLHAKLTLIKFEKDLNSISAKQLFLFCICIISNYESEIWYNKQKQFEKQNKNGGKRE